MPFRKSSLMDSTGIPGMAQQWGKIVARRVHEQVGPDLDLDADDIEQVAMRTAFRQCIVLRGWPSYSSLQSEVTTLQLSAPQPSIACFSAPPLVGDLPQPAAPLPSTASAPHCS